MVVYGADGLTSRAQARDLLALAAAEHWGLMPLPELVCTPHGKPYFPQKANCQFNLSHSGSLALCALDKSPVGVDIQVVKRWRSALPARVCSQRELDWLSRQNDHWSAFTTLWAMKESWVKYTGQGLTIPISSVCVPIPGKDSLLRWGKLWFRLYAGYGWRAAVCGTCPPPPRILWHSLLQEGGGPIDS